MDTCFIFGAETFYGQRRKPQPGEYIIAANAGLRTCQQMGLTSVFCLRGNAHGVDLEGASIPCMTPPSPPGFPLGVSNHIVESQARVSVWHVCFAG